MSTVEVDMHIVYALKRNFIFMSSVFYRLLSSYRESIVKRSLLESFDCSTKVCIA